MMSESIILGGERDRNFISPSVGRLFEGGHFYRSKGPTRWTVLSWELVNQLSDSTDKRIIMIDDVHPASIMHPSESAEPTVEFAPLADWTVYESDMGSHGLEVLAMLCAKSLRRRRRARKRGKDGRWVCSGSLLTTPAGEPMCLLYDLGLTLYKYRRGHRHIVNVLPEFYYSEQHALMRISRRIMPDLLIEAVLFDLSENWRLLRLK